MGSAGPPGPGNAPDACAASPGGPFQPIFGAVQTPERSPAELRFPALIWVLLHVPLILLLYNQSILAALDGVPPRFQAALVALYVVEAAVIAGVVYCLALPFSLAPKVYRYAAPFVTSLALVVLLIDSRMYAALNFHINGLFFRVIVQPHMLNEIGLRPWEAWALIGVWVLWIAVSVWAGSRFIRRFAAPRRVAAWLALLLALQVADRFALAWLNFRGGPAVFAAGQVLPLQVRFTMNGLWSKWTGRPVVSDPVEVAAGASRAHLPPGASPEQVRILRRPDVIIALIESTRADFLDSLTMPHLWQRARQGARFLREYSSATSTHYSLFSLFYSLQPQKFETVVGEGRPPLLFGALKRAGYASRLIAASSVDWMGMRRTVFGAVDSDLVAEVEGEDGAARDSSMVALMQQFVSSADTARPLFLFLFFDGTHFNYSFPPSSEVFRPDWDGRGSIEATRVAPALLVNRARNSAYEVDRKLDAFLRWERQARGREPLLFVTGDHGEEFREHGRVGHGSEVTEEQVHVPLVVSGPGVPVREVPYVTSSVDIVPTILSLLGDTLPPARYGDGRSLFAGPSDRFVLSSVGWEPKFALIGRDIKAVFSSYDAGLSSVRITDPWDRPLPDADARFAAEAPQILRAFARKQLASPPDRPGS